MKRMPTSRWMTQCLALAITLSPCCLVTLSFVLADQVLAPDPPAKEEPPVRLKKKKPRGEERPMIEPDKPEEKKKDEMKEDKKAEPREAEPVTPQEEEKEVLQRVVQNVHRVDERLAKNDLGEATQQTQRDILKDLESLIKRNEEPPPPPSGDGQQDQNNGGGGGGAKSSKKAGAGARSRMQQQQRGSGKANSERRAGKDGKGGEQPGGRNGTNGNGGRGGDQDDHARKNADLDKHGVWGHLPQSLRAQMDAYSNPHPFMPKYDDLIKRYYRTISEQGRRKGE
jgi:hypothetical protein